jgi:hypothetical protein
MPKWRVVTPWSSGNYPQGLSKDLLHLSSVVRPRTWRHNHARHSVAPRIEAVVRRSSHPIGPPTYTEQGQGSPRQSIRRSVLDKVLNRPRSTIQNRDETATTPVPPTEEATAWIERRGACMSERLALVFHSPRVGRSVLGAGAAALAGAASRTGDLAHCNEHRTTRHNDDRRTPDISEGTYACACVSQASSGSGGTR